MTTTADLAYVRKEEEPVLPPPRGRVSGIEAIYANLFSSFTNMVLTVIGLALVILVVPPIIRWAFIDAVWTGENRDACVGSGSRRVLGLRQGEVRPVHVWPLYRSTSAGGSISPPSC